MKERLDKKQFILFAIQLAFPIMIQNLISTLVNSADTLMLGYVSQTAMAASSLANQYTFVLFCFYYGLGIGTSVLCAQYYGKGDKQTVERIIGLASRVAILISLVFFAVSFFIHRKSGNHSRRSSLSEGTVLFLCFYGIFTGFRKCPAKCGKNHFPFGAVCGVPACQCADERHLYFWIVRTAPNGCDGYRQEQWR